MMKAENPVEADIELVRRTRSGAPDALAALYRRYAPDVLRITRRMMGSVADAEDATHDVFVGLPEALAKYDERGRFAPWLSRVAARVALSRMRRQRTRRESDLVDASHVHVAPNLDNAQWSLLQRAIDELPASLRTVFVLREMEGYTHAETAALLGISVRASEVRVSRAFKLLREKLRS